MEFTEKNITKYEIQAVGSFNPVIIQPDWFRKFKILPEQEIEFVYLRFAVSFTVCCVA